MEMLVRTLRSVHQADYATRRAVRYKMSVKLKITFHLTSLHSQDKIQVSLLVWHQYVECEKNLKEWWRVICEGAEE
jgi:hypothetical protein